MYAMPLQHVYILILFGIALWFVLGALLDNTALWRILNLCGIIASLAIILFFSVLGRSHKDSHDLVFAAAYTNEFWREMVMNAFLYFPLGIFLTHLLRKYLAAICAGFGLSILIELWQYCAGTGLAQGTDVICNTIGAAVGGISFVLLQLYVNKKNRKH